MARAKFVRYPSRMTAKRRRNFGSENVRSSKCIALGLSRLTFAVQVSSACSSFVLRGRKRASFWKKEGKSKFESGRDVGSFQFNTYPELLQLFVHHCKWKLSEQRITQS